MNYLPLIIITCFTLLEYISSTTTQQKEKGKFVFTSNTERLEDQIEGNDTINKKRRGPKPGGTKLSKVAVIGGEIIAALFKYHMNKINNTVIVDIFEHESQNNDDLFIVHERQKYMMNIVQELSLTVCDLYPNNNTPVIYDGVENNCQTYQPYKQDFRSFISKSIAAFQYIYRIQGKNSGAVETIQQLILKMDPEFETLLKIPIAEICDENWFKGHQKLENFVKSTVLLNYGQNLDINAFAGLFSIAYSELTGKSVKIIDPFKKVFDKLSIIGPGRILKGKVLKVLEGTIRHVVTWQDENEKMNNDLYDYVVIATSNINNIDFTSFRELIKVCKHQKLVFTTINGYLKPNSSLGCQYPNLKDIIDIVNVKNNKFNVANRIGTDKWKFISDNILHLSDLNTLFEITKFESSEENNLYPDFSDMHCISNLKFDLGKRLYSVNIVEWASNLLEMKAIGARNVALIIHRMQKLHGSYKNLIVYHGKKIRKS